VSLGAYMRESRLSVAASMLVSTDQSSVERIAKACGFVSIFAFSRAFKKAMGHSPRAYHRFVNHGAIRGCLGHVRRLAMSGRIRDCAPPSPRKRHPSQTRTPGEPGGRTPEDSMVRSAWLPVRGLERLHCDRDWHAGAKFGKRRGRVGIGTRHAKPFCRPGGKFKCCAGLERECSRVVRRFRRVMMPLTGDHAAQP